MTRHALQRLQEHHAHIGFRGALGFFSRAVEVEGAIIAPFLGRRLEDVRDRYYVTHDGMGVFVVVRARQSDKRPWVIVTYVRFGDYQRSVAQRLLEVA